MPGICDIPIVSRVGVDRTIFEGTAGNTRGRTDYCAPACVAKAPLAPGVPNNLNTLVSFTQANQTSDPLGMLVNGAGILTDIVIPTIGIYRVDIGLFWTVAAQLGSRVMSLIRNGGVEAQSFMTVAMQNPIAAFITPQTLSWQGRCAVGDILQLQLFQNSGAGDAFINAFPYMSVAFAAPVP